MSSAVRYYSTVVPPHSHSTIEKKGTALFLKPNYATRHSNPDLRSVKIFCSSINKRIFGFTNFLAAEAIEARRKSWSLATATKDKNFKVRSKVIPPTLGQI
jgi:hypothetical protein